MAEFVDRYSDFEELGISSEEDKLTLEFNQAAKHIETIASNIDNKVLLRLYGYYKQATTGPCNVPKPSWFDMKAKSKWEAWNSLGSLSQDEAKTNYIQIVRELDSNFEFRCEEKPNEASWVSVSTMQAEEPVNASEKSLIDFVKEGNVTKLHELLSNTSRAILNELDKDGLGLIHWAADRGSVEVLRTLISHKVDVNLTDTEGQTALHYAVSCGHVECVKFLLDNGANVHIKDSEGTDVLSLDCDDLIIKDLLLSHK